jgi:two-component system, sensor histidine kinase and response regulator
MLLRQADILVVDDDPACRYIARELIGLRGARVDVAANGAEALQRVVAAPPDLVLCDLTMPVMDGLEFARQVRRHPQYEPVCLVAVTGRQDQTAYEWTWSVGFDGHIAKPLTVSVLSTLEHVLREDVEHGGCPLCATPVRWGEAFSIDGGATCHLQCRVDVTARRAAELTDEARDLVKESRALRAWAQAERARSQARRSAASGDV